MMKFMDLFDRILMEGASLKRSEFNGDISIFEGVGGYDDGKRMSSKEIARVTGKRHSDVLRAIRNMEPAWEKEHGRKFAFTFIIKDLPNGAQRKDPIYNLTKIECLYVATKFSDAMRAKLVTRWEELEQRNLEETRDPSKAVSRAVAIWKKQGKSDAWIQTRTQGIAQRHVFTDTLQEHGVHDSGYGLCTNAIYKPILGGTNKEVKEKRNLPRKVNLRDTLTGVELASVMLAEALATERIGNNNAQGNIQCAKHSMIAATSVSKAVDDCRK